MIGIARLSRLFHYIPLLIICHSCILRKLIKLIKYTNIHDELRKGTIFTCAKSSL